MGSSEHQDEVDDAYVEVFGTPSGRIVLVDLAERCHALRSTLSTSGNPFETHVNEGKRCTYLYIVSKADISEHKVRELRSRSLTKQIEDSQK